MVKKKSSTGFLEDELFLPKWPVLDERWYVIEHTPAYNTGGYYDQDVPAKNVKVSPYFNDENAAKTWMDEHEPDKGKVLIVWKDQLFERKVREWRYDYDYNRTRKNRASVVE